MRHWLVGLMVLLLGCGVATGHPMPNSVLTLDVGEHAIAGEIVIPLIELDLAMGTDFSSDPAVAIAAAQDRIRGYLAAHVSASTPEGQAWTIAIDDIHVPETANVASPSYAELVARLLMTPPEAASVRQFTLNYDAVLHRVVTHYALVTVGEDWLNGQIDAHGEPVSLGVIKMNPIDNAIAPLSVDLSQGSYWQGFVAMFQLGISHIAEGTDHLLFLLTLLLPAPLLAVGARWGGKAGMRGTLFSALKIVTAFTIGHSLTLIVATLLRLNLPQQPIEVVIAATILISAIHALRPIFPGREALVAGLFGLIHGMAFSFTLAELNLSSGQLAVSLLGFNLGIELLQLGIVALVLPSLLLFADSGYYAPVRIAGAALAILASLGWLADRLGFNSTLAILIDTVGQQLPMLIVGLAMASALVWGFSKMQRSST
jgi:hypothetical protein